MPRRSKGKDGLTPGPPSKGNQDILTIKKPKIKRVRTYVKRGQAWGAIRSLGESIGSMTDLDINLPKIQFPKDMRVKFFSRVFDESGDLVKNSILDGRYRSTWAEQDELLSTATVRNLIQGLLNERKESEITKEERELYELLIDLCSALRIPTRYSGFSTSKVVMQHPTAVGSGFFSDKNVDGPHGRYDSDRVKYIGEAVKLSQEANESIDDQVRTMMRAAIEFSLNYFTAPITAINVQPFSTKKGIKTTDESLLKQIASREQIKDIYVKLGGELRNLESEDGKVVEEPEDESLTRKWQRDLKITSQDPFPFAPPSPLRKISKKKDPPPTPDTKVPVGSGSVVPSNPFGSILSNLALQQTTPSGSTSQVVQGSFSSNTLMQNTITVGIQPMPNLNLGLVQPMTVRLPIGDVLPIANQTAQQSRKRQRDSSRSDDSANKVLRSVQTHLHDSVNGEEAFGDGVFDPHLLGIEPSGSDLGAFDWNGSEEFGFNPNELYDPYLNPLDYRPSAPPLEEFEQNDSNWFTSDLDESGSNMFDPNGIGSNDLDAVDDFVEHDYPRVEANIFPGQTQVQMESTGMDMGIEPFPGMEFEDPILLQLPEVPTHPITNDLGDIGYPPVPGNMMGDGLGDDLIDEIGEGAGAVEGILALF